MDGGYGVADGEARADALALSIGYKDCEQAFASSVFDFMAHSLERGFTELEFYGPGESLYASTIRGTIFGGVMNDLSTIR